MRWRVSWVAVVVGGGGCVGGGVIGQVRWVVVEAEHGVVAGDGLGEALLVLF